MGMAEYHLPKVVHAVLGELPPALMATRTGLSRERFRAVILASRHELLSNYI